MWIISFIALAGTAIVLQFMPDQVPMHYDAVGNIDRWESKYENLIFPVFILAMAAIGAVILASAITLVYAHKVYVQEIKSEKGGKD